MRKLVSKYDVIRLLITVGLLAYILFQTYGDK